MQVYINKRKRDLIYSWLFLLSLTGCNKTISCHMRPYNDFNGRKAFPLVPQHYPSLYYATREYYTKMVVSMLNNGEVNERDYNGLTALHYAAREGHTKIIALILNNGTEVNEKDYNGLTALHYAAREGHPEVVNLLLKHGAEVNVKDKENKTPLYLAIEHCCARKVAGVIKIVHMLLKNNRLSNIYAKSEINQKALNIAIEKGYIGIIKSMLQAGADVNARVDDDQDTPLHYATRFNHLPIFLLLYERNAQINAKNRVYETALHIAAMYGHQEIVKTLLKIYEQEDINVNELDYYNRTPLYCAAQFNRPSIVSLLLEMTDAQIDAKNDDHETALHIAVIHGNQEIVETLLKAYKKKHIKPNSMDLRARTPLYYAVARNDITMVEWLLDAGAEESIELQDRCGNTPLKLAAQNGYKNILDLLKLNDVSRNKE